MEKKRHLEMLLGVNQMLTLDAQAFHIGPCVPSSRLVAHRLQGSIQLKVDQR